MLEHVFTELGYPTIGQEYSLEVEAEHFAVVCRIKAVEEELPAFIKMAQNVEQTWVRYLAYTVLAIFGTAYVFPAFYTPHGRNSLGSQTPTLRTYVTLV